MTQKWSLFLFLAVGLVAGCNRGEKPQEGRGRVFGVSFQVMNNPFFVDLNEGLKEVIEARGDRLVTLDGQFNSLKQKNDIADLLQQRAAGVFINPVNWEGIRGSLKQARQMNVPAIIVDAPVKEADLAVCTVASDNFEAGRLAAAALGKARPDAKLVILHLFPNKACIDRVAGFQEGMKKFPKMQLLDTQEAKGTAEAARPVMLDLLGRYKDLNAVFAVNDPIALGSISAIESTGRLSEVTVVAVDGSSQAAEAILAGKLLSTSAQFPREIGRRAAEKMYEHLEGKTVENDIKIRVELVTKENAAQFLRK